MLNADYTTARYPDAANGVLYDWRGSGAWWLRLPHAIVLSMRSYAYRVEALHALEMQ